MMFIVGKNDILSNFYNMIKDIIFKNFFRKRKFVKKVKYVFKFCGV